ncbi:MAG: type IV pilus modification protein PilV [Deltaproteobacteria bacterium]|nr:type IV pilus modification protein PilV [Deltaproteobacteria bacterium]
MTGSRGFTLVEVLIAVTILSIGILGIAGLAGTVVKSSSYSKSVTQATNIAQDKIESLLSVDFDNLQSTDTTTARTDLRRTCVQTDATLARPVYTCTPSSTITKDGRTYTWAYTVTLIDLDASGNASADGLKRLDVTVSWMDAVWNSTRSLTLTTLRSAEFVN